MTKPITIQPAADIYQQHGFNYGPRVRIVDTGDRIARSNVWAVHLDGTLIGWIQRSPGSTAGQGLLSGWEFESDTHNPLGPQTNSFFVEGRRENMMRMITHLAAPTTEPEPEVASCIHPWEPEPEAVAALIAVCLDLACALESYSDDHNSPRPTDVTVLLPALREALANVGGDA